MDYDFRSAKKAFSRVGIALIMFFVATYAAQILLGAVWEVFFPSLLESGMTYTHLVAISSATMYLIGTPVFYLCLRGIDKFEGEKEPCSLQTLAVAFAISMALMYFGQMIGDTLATFIYSTFGIAFTSETLEIVSQISWLDALIFSAIIGPFFEELMFRKLIIDRTRGYGEKLSVIFSALMFAFFHMSVQQFFYAFFIGLLYGYLYIRKGRLLYNWLLHAVFNFFGAVVPLMFKEFVEGYDKLLDIAVSESAYEEFFDIVAANPFSYSIVFFFSLATLTLSFVGTFFLGKKIQRMRFEPALFELPKESEATTAFVNVGVILFIAFAVIYPFVVAALG